MNVLVHISCILPDGITVVPVVRSFQFGLNLGAIFNGDDEQYRIERNHHRNWYDEKWDAATAVTYRKNQNKT